MTPDDSTGASDTNFDEQVGLDYETRTKEGFFLYKRLQHQKEKEVGPSILIYTEKTSVVL